VLYNEHLTAGGLYLTLMNDDHPPSPSGALATPSETPSGKSAGKNTEHKSWFERLVQLISGEPRNREELLEVLTEAQEREIIDADTFNMFEGAMDVSEKHVRDAMIPRGQIVALPCDSSLPDLLDIIVESGHSRFPVIKDDKDEVKGILLAKDVLRFVVQGEKNFDINALLRDPVFIPESKRLNILLKDFRSSRNHMAMVVDEFGGVAGLITIEDVLEEIVGEIDDEHDEEEAASIVPQANGSHLVSALTPIDQFNEHFESELNDEEFDTIGGLLTGELGRLPELGETVTIDNFAFKVLRGDNRRLHTLELTHQR